MSTKTKKIISIIGGGPAAMMLACQLDSNLFEIRIYEKMNQIGKKFLVAGKGGFNLTSGDDMADLIRAYDAADVIIQSIRRFGNDDLRNWLSNIGIETFIGSSGRVFPEPSIKPIHVLNTIKSEMAKNQVTINTGYTWISTDQSGNTFIHKEEKVHIASDITVCAMGGASWSKTGSDGSWKEEISKMNIRCNTFAPANCALHLDWPESVKLHEGKPLKNIALSYQKQYIKGELVITKKGLEGTPAYTLSNAIGRELEANDSAVIYLDLKPNMSLKSVMEKLDNSDAPMSKRLKNRLSLSPQAIAILKAHIAKEEFLNTKTLATKIKSLSLHISGLAPIDEAISSTGGIAESVFDEEYRITTVAEIYAIGEMLDWHAPTGGYLLQACFSMGWDLAQKLNSKHKKRGQK